MLLGPFFLGVLFAKDGPDLNKPFGDFGIGFAICAHASLNHIL